MVLEVIWKMKYCKRPKALKGGIGQHADPRKINKRVLELGIKTEMEHTNNRCTAMWVAIDHLTEFPGPGYYKELMKMERKLKKS
jgi:hypothetical protein